MDKNAFKAFQSRDCQHAGGSLLPDDVALAAKIVEAEVEARIGSQHKAIRVQAEAMYCHGQEYHTARSLLGQDD